MRVKSKISDKMLTDSKRVKHNRTRLGSFDTCLSVSFERYCQKLVFFTKSQEYEVPDMVELLQSLIENIQPMPQLFIPEKQP